MKLFFFIIILLILIVIIKSHFEINNYVINKEKVYCSKIKECLNIVFLTDLHEKLFKNNNDDLINSILDLDPDYIILGGDFIINSSGLFNKNEFSMHNTIDFIDKLCRRNNGNVKIVFSYGNHELRLKESKSEVDNYSFKLLNEVLKKHNIKIIDDDFVDFDENTRLYGISILKGFYKKSFIFNNKKHLLTNKIINDRLKDIDENKFNIVLCHTPDYAESLIDYGFDMVLSGHYHGGLIRLPIIGTVFSPDLAIFPRYSYGLYKYKNKYIYVSNGLGEHFIKIRFLNTPSFLNLRLIGDERN